MSILEQAHQIVDLRSEEKEREYGPFSEGMERAAKLLSNMTGKQYEPEELFLALVALKLSRHSFKYKQDNLLDAVSYLGALDNYIQSKNGK